MKSMACPVNWWNSHTTEVAIAETTTTSATITVTTIVGIDTQTTTVEAVSIVVATAKPVLLSLLLMQPPLARPPLFIWVPTAALSRNLKWTAINSKPRNNKSDQQKDLAASGLFMTVIERYEAMLKLPNEYHCDSLQHSIKPMVRHTIILIH